MASIQEIYGSNYQSESLQLRRNHIINHIANNLAHRQFRFHLSDQREVWGSEQSMLPDCLHNLLSRVPTLNPKMKITQLNKNKIDHMRLLPELVFNIPVEYLMIVDNEMERAYFLYITPNEVSSY
jgi:hypothetical protein